MPISAMRSTFSDDSGSELSDPPSVIAEYPSDKQTISDAEDTDVFDSDISLAIYISQPEPKPTFLPRESPEEPEPQEVGITAETKEAAADIINEGRESDQLGWNHYQQFAEATIYGPDTPEEMAKEAADAERKAQENAAAEDAARVTEVRRLKAAEEERKEERQKDEEREKEQEEENKKKKEKAAATSALVQARKEADDKAAAKAERDVAGCRAWSAYMKAKNEEYEKTSTTEKEADIAVAEDAGAQADTDDSKEEGDISLATSTQSTGPGLSLVQRLTKPCIPSYDFRRRWWVLLLFIYMTYKTFVSYRKLSAWNHAATVPRCDYFGVANLEHQSYLDEPSWWTEAWGIFGFLYTSLVGIWVFSNLSWFKGLN